MSMTSINAFSDLLGVHPLVIVAVLIWSLAWKGVALWRAAGLRQQWWFLAILLINTLGVLEIVYLFVITRNYKVEVVEQN